jgi:ribosomal-protein-alanine N-acetyltransferase
MPDQPTVEARRLRLRPLGPRDAAAIQAAASARVIADTMISLPHPYPDGEAERYLARQQSEREQGRAATFAIERKLDGRFCGLVEVREIDQEHSQAELSFWLAVEAWGRGYMTEAIEATTRYGFRDLGLNRLYAYHMLRNPASGRVLEKNGFRREGLLRQRVRKWGRFEDVVLWAILRRDGPDSL